MHGVTEVQGIEIWGAWTRGSDDRPDLRQYGPTFAPSERLRSREKNFGFFKSAARLSRPPSRHDEISLGFLRAYSE